MIDDLVEGDRREIRELHFDDGAHPLQRRTDRKTGHRILADRRVQHAVRIHLGESFCGLERPAECGDVLPIQKHARVFPQQGFLRFTNGIDVGNTHAFYVGG